MLVYTFNGLMERYVQEGLRSVNWETQYVLGQQAVFSDLLECLRQ